MIALILFGIFFTGLMTFVIVRISISCMFWSSKNPNDKQHIFKVYFPYYIIILSIICIAFIIKFNKSLLAIYYFSAVYIIALSIWRNEMKSRIKKKKNFAVEPNQSHLP
ncbi:hypothetical protein H8K90_00485 [Winogradskyella echinorum]|uniref:Uncharacterized protein n=1 Tax=Winogradskyella echinorum TaxID=538189 RepID=A0ABR6XWF9_9FLAO|nr:hypothetical protein [Winogradskyella echinorum]MBC3844842.1 hypothetical protein [Winogradskyella echinorum]MBC5749190.1 hypothetical protein [Winogradskyella echinorum]